MAKSNIPKVRECVNLFLRLAKSTGVPIILVGHVTKSGDVAGPRTVEHMVDAVLYLEGDRSTGGPNVRMLRAAKNRFGSSDEVGVYEMKASGSGSGGGRLVPVSDPSSLFLSNRADAIDAEGCAVSLVTEGQRPMAAEVQALVAWNPGGMGGKGGGSYGGRRTVHGVSTSRLLLILAVLQKRYGISFSRRDVYVNVVGGVRLSGGFGSSGSKGGESDLAVAVSLVSSLVGIPVRSDTAFVGEVGLLGELRPVPDVERRIGEARRMGFSRVVTPSRYANRRRGRGNVSNQRKQDGSSAGGVGWIECDNLLDAINAGLVAKLPTRRGRDGQLRLKRVQKDEGDAGGVENGLQIKSPGTLEELMLGEEQDVIQDDEEDVIFG